MDIIRGIFSDVYSIISYKIVDNSIEVLLSTFKLGSCCPLCGKETHKYHSSYSRVMIDLPFVDKTLILFINVHRYFCTNELCSRKIFCERLSEFAKVYARRTNRLEFGYFCPSPRKGALVS